MYRAVTYATLRAGADFTQATERIVVANQDRD